MFRIAYVFVAAFMGFTCCALARAATMTYFDPSQIATIVAEGTTWDKIRSNGYYFTYTRDKLFTGGGSTPIGRYVRIPWPQGVEAQAVTAGPNPGKAKITIERVDGDIFDFTTFTAKLLANTGGAGGSFEVVPFLNGEEMLPDPVVFNASGSAGNTFSYDTSPNPGGSTVQLTGYDKYSIDLYVDFALIGLTFTGAPIPGPPGDYNNDLVVDAADYIVWRKNDGTQSEYNTWRTHFGEVAGAGAELEAAESPPVPEPYTLVILLIAAPAMSLQRIVMRPYSKIGDR